MKTVIIATAALIMFLGMSVGGAGRTYGEWETSIALSPVGGGISLAGSTSTLKGMYFTGEVADLSIAQLSKLAITDRGLSGTGMGVQAYFALPIFSPGGFSVSTYLEQEIVIDWPIGTYTVLSNAVFSVTDPALKRGWLELGVSAYGLKGTGSFLLLPAGSGYALGAAFALQGTTLAGLSVEAVSYFGAWSVGEEFTDVSPVPGEGTCLCYNGTDISLSGLMFGCASYDTAIRLTQSGFSYVRFDVAVDTPADWWIPVRFDLALEFYPQTKSLILTVPTLYYFNSCDGSFTVYLGLEITGGTGDGPSFSGLRWAGLRVNDLPLGGATLDGIISFGDPLYADVKDDEINLHADDYNFVAEGTETGSPIPYEMVISLIRGTGNFSAVFDAYFKEGGSLFGLALLTGEASYILSSDLEFGLGMALDPSYGLKELRAEFAWSLYR